MEYIKNKPETSQRQNVKISFAASAAFSLAANAFAYFNLTPHHDAINNFLHFAGDWEITLGRFLLPIWGSLFKRLYMPWFDGMLSILFLSISVWLCTEILNIRSKTGIILTAGFLSINYSITELCASFEYVLSAYTFSIMLVFAAIWAVTKRQSKADVFIAAILICISMCFYQAYITIGFTLFLILIMQQTAAREDLSTHLSDWLRYITAFAMGGVLYFATYKAVFHYSGKVAPDSVNSLSQLTNLDINYLMDRLDITYKLFIRLWFLGEFPYTRLTALINLVLIAVTVLVVIRQITKREGAKAGRIILFFIFIAIFPPASMLIRLIMDVDRTDYLVNYAMFLIYPGCISLIEMCEPITSFVRGKSEKQNNVRIEKKALYLASFIILISYVRFSNEAHTVSKLIYDRTITTMTSIMTTMDATEEYLPGKTEVAFIGRLDSDESGITSEEAINRLSSIRGFLKIGVTYPVTYEKYFRYMGHPINIIKEEATIKHYEIKPEVMEMPCYPNKGYCRMLDGVMTVKLSPEGSE